MSVIALDEISLGETPPIDVSNSRTLLKQEKTDTRLDVGECSILVEKVLEELLLEAVTGACIESHQTAKLGLMFLYADGPTDRDDSLDRRGSPRKIRQTNQGSIAEFAMHDSAYIDVFGQPIAAASKIPRAHECQCPECGRTLAAVRFAPHLEKCMGMGRNSSRVASRRLMNCAVNNTQHNRRSSSVTSSSRTRDESTDESSEPGEEDDDWTGGRKKNQPRRKQANLRRPLICGSSEKRKPASRAPMVAKLSPEYPKDDPLLSTFAETPSNNITFDMLNESPAGCDSPGSESLQLRSRKVKKSGTCDLVRVPTEPILTSMGTRAHGVPPFEDSFGLEYDCDDVMNLMHTVDTSAFEQLSRDMGSFHSVT